MSDQDCQRVINRRGKRLEDGTRLDEDELCTRLAVTDVLVTFNGNAYIVPLCAEHKSAHDQAGADRRKKRSGDSRRERDAAATQRRVDYVRNNSHNLLETALTRTGSGGSR